MSASTSIYLQELADAGDARAKIALRIVSNLDTYLSANQLGVTLASLALGWLGEPAFATLIRYAVGKLGTELLFCPLFCPGGSPR